MIYKSEDAPARSYYFAFAMERQFSLTVLHCLNEWDIGVKVGGLLTPALQSYSLQSL